ncbi:MAG: hypothetical protein EBS18_05230 [Actinobacteria bacterium]|nr:hypothetical protein [Actinomycetota bacterium]
MIESTDPHKTVAVLGSCSTIESDYYQNHLYKSGFKSVRGFALQEVIHLIEKGVQPKPQPSGGASLAPKFRKEDGAIDWSQEAIRIYNKFRAISENPGVYTNYLGSRLKLNELRVLDSKTLPEGYFDLINGELLVGTKDLDILINRLTPEGRKQMSGKDFINGLATKENLNFA